MIHWKLELIAFWEKYKDAETLAEWELLVRELDRFDHPEVIAQIVRCVEAIEERYRRRRLAQTDSGGAKVIENY